MKTKRIITKKAENKPIRTSEQSQTFRHRVVTLPSPWIAPRAYALGGGVIIISMSIVFMIDQYVYYY